MTRETIQEITITGCNPGKTGPMLTTGYKLLASFYFTLSASPPEEWIQVFEQVRHDRSRRRHPLPLPRTRIDSRGIVINCRPDDLQQHYDDLKADVTTTNQKHREMLEQSARDEEVERSIARAIDEALGKLKL